MKLFTGGTVLTMDRGRPRVDAVAIDGDRIAAVGEASAVRAAAPGGEEVDLGGACLVPGFIDAHHHFSEGALITSGVNLHWPAVNTVGDILARVRERAAEIPAGEWVLAEGYDERWLVEGRAPTLAELGAACPNHPVLLVHFSYHEVVVNTRAHEKMGLRLHRFDPPGGEIERDRRGWPTGRMIENAAAPFYMGAIRELLARDEEAYFNHLARYQERLFRKGVTRLYDPAVSPLMEGMLRRATERGLLRVSVLMMPCSADGMFMPPRDRLDGPRTGAGADPLRTGPLKVFMDGGLRCAMRLPLLTAAAGVIATLRQVARQRSLAPLRLAKLTPLRLDLAARCVRSGILFYEEDEARDLVRAAVERGMSVAIHAEGNVAIDRALRVLPPSRANRSVGVSPNRIEHFFFPDPDAVGRAGTLGLAVAVQPTISEWIGDQLLDIGLIGRQPFMPLRALLDAGLVVAGSSDAPVVDFDPLRGIRCAVERKTAKGRPLNDGQQVTVAEALEMYTVHAARSGGLEEEVGTLAPGKRADMVVLSKDPTQWPPSDLAQVNVVRTICGGVDVYP